MDTWIIVILTCHFNFIVNGLWLTIVNEYYNCRGELLVWASVTEITKSPADGQMVIT